MQVVKNICTIGCEIPFLLILIDITDESGGIIKHCSADGLKAQRQDLMNQPITNPHIDKMVRKLKGFFL